MLTLLAGNGVKPYFLILLIFMLKMLLLSQIYQIHMIRGNCFVAVAIFMFILRARA